MPLRYARSRTCWETGVHVLSALFSTELRAWHRAEPLGKVFWGYGILASTVLTLIYLLAIDQNRVAIQRALLIVLFAYTVWILVAIWRCAAGPIWGRLARWLTIACAGNTILILTFLQMDLFAAYIGRWRALLCSARQKTCFPVISRWSWRLASYPLLAICWQCPPWPTR